MKRPRTGKDQDTIRADLMRDNFMSAEQVRRLTSGFDGCMLLQRGVTGIERQRTTASLIRQQVSAGVPSPTKRRSGGQLR